ncbi:Crp/Fnr family transcriptional regulator [Vibrio rumoiensis]|uniref:Crp/Fnr family transcriptional regulator n=1 Tax=Vibrio rumoiensis TaxID=76258 RepID=A0ABW7IYD1_9VIBR
MDFNSLLKTKGIRIEKEKGEHVFMQGQPDRCLYFVQSGLLKAYYTSDQGKESIKSFLLPNDTIGSLVSFHTQDACSFSLLCLESSVLYKLTFEVIQYYVQQDLELANNMLEFLLGLAVKKEQREYEFLCLSAEQRFFKLEKYQPTLIDKVTQNDLAHYLGVTAVGLSRIKKRAHTNGLLSRA